MPDFDSPAALAAGLADAGYLADEGLATAGFLALRLHRPIFLEGDAGVGKTAFAAALAQVAGVELIRLQCYEGLDAAQALYDWDFPRQILHLRALEAAGDVDSDEAEKSLYDERFLLSRPVLAALRQAPAVLLVDEVDRADDEFEAFLLEVLSTWQVTIPEFGTVTAASASNSSRYASNSSSARSTSSTSSTHGARSTACNNGRATRNRRSYSSASTVDGSKRPPPARAAASTARRCRTWRGKSQSYSAWLASSPS